MPLLEILNGPQVGQRTLINHETFFIGRDTNNHLVLSERTVSRKHAVINQVEAEYTISDLKSLKGLLINGEKAEERTLQDGDEIALGALRLRFLVDDNAPDSPLPTPQKKGKKWPLFLVALLIVGGLFFWLRSQPAEHKEVSETTTPASSSSAASNTSIEEPYRKGIAFYNEGNLEEARKQWEEVLKLDPDQKTSFGQKAAKLLKNLPK